jgi:3-methyladenine DNA glycosylase AlkD
MKEIFEIIYSHSIATFFFIMAIGWALSAIIHKD